MSTDSLIALELGDTHDPARLIPGDPEALSADARSIEEIADTLATVADRVSGVDLGGWVGHAADAYAQSTDPLRTAILVAATAFSNAATALRTHASTLEWAQGQARTAIRQYDAAAGCVPPGPLGAVGIPVGQSRATDVLAQARAEVYASGNTAAATIESATADAPINPGFWNQAGYQWSEFWHGATEAVTGIGQLAWDHNTIRLIVDPDGWTKSTTELATGLVAAVKDPVQLGRDVIDYDTWTTSPARAAGHLAPDAIIAALTAGGGLAATRGAEAGANVATASVRVGEDLAASATAARSAVAARFASAMASGAEHGSANFLARAGAAEGVAGLAEGADAAVTTSAGVLRDPAALEGLKPSQIDDLARNAGYDILPGKAGAVNPATRYYLPGTNGSVGFRVLPGGVAGQTGIKGGAYLRFFGESSAGLRIPLESP